MQNQKVESKIKLRNGIEMPIMGIGTSLRGKKPIDSDSFCNLLKHAINYGYRLIDSAKCYNNEHIVAKAIKECDVDRKDLFVVSKLYFEDMGYEKALKAFDKTCQKLQVDYLDQYLIHFPGIPTDNRKKTQPTLEKAKELRLESWRALEKLYNEGKCKSIGVSNYMKRHLDEIVEANMTIPMVNQSEFHPYYNNKEIFDVCKEMGIVFVGYSPLGKGNILNDSIITNMAAKYSKTPAQITLKWSIQNNVVTIPASTNLERVEENLNINDFVLEEEDFNLIWTLNKNEKVSWDPTDVI